MKGLSWSIAYLIAEEFDIPQFFYRLSYCIKIIFE